MRYETICTCFKNAIKALFASLGSSLVQNIVLKLYTFIGNTQYCPLLSLKHLGIDTLHTEDLLNARQKAYNHFASIRSSYTSLKVRMK